jgi:hypothetical protein
LSKVKNRQNGENSPNLVLKEEECPAGLPDFT